MTLFLSSFSAMSFVLFIYSLIILLLLILDFPYHHTRRRFNRHLCNFLQDRIDYEHDGQLEQEHSGENHGTKSRVRRRWRYKFHFELDSTMKIWHSKPPKFRQYTFLLFPSAFHNYIYTSVYFEWRNKPEQNAICTTKCNFILHYLFWTTLNNTYFVTIGSTIL